MLSHAIQPPSPEILAALKAGTKLSQDLTKFDLRAADLTDIEFEQIESIAGADFSQVQGLSAEKRSHLLSHSTQELETWNSFTRRTTRDSLEGKS
jgi:hypothetical protein